MDYEAFMTHVELFNRTFGARYDFGLRLGLMVEELGEWTESVLKDKPKETQEDELADLLYVLFGLADVADYDMEAAMLRVAKKNQSKIENRAAMKIGAGGKVIKPTDAN